MARAAAVQKEYARQVAKASKENKKTADAVADSVTVGVGLIQRQGSEDSKSS
jgi:NADH dehydrogenase (ubiquinone) Fe-S protein 5